MFYLSAGGLRSHDHAESRSLHQNGQKLDELEEVRILLRNVGWIIYLFIYLNTISGGQMSSLGAWAKHTVMPAICKFYKDSYLPNGQTEKCI